MSLVTEALRKARRQSGAGGPHEGGAVVPPTLVLPPRVPRPRLGAAPLLLVAAAAAVGGAAGVWWVVGRQRVEPAPGPLPRAPEAVATAAGAAPAPVATRTTALAPAAASATPAISLQGEPGSPPAPAAQAAPLAVPGQEAVTPEGEVADRRERPFLIDADLGYAKLHLDYLVYRPGSPFGRVNGQDVVTGTTVSGFVVEEITADYIKLADRRNTVILRVR